MTFQTGSKDYCKPDKPIFAALYLNARNLQSGLTHRKIYQTLG